MVEAATNFRKSGFNNADSATLAQVAAQYQNIADTAVSASDAAASITSQIRAFGEDASFATTVINAYNEVANRFSVGTNDISNAMEIASSGMATYGNSFQQVIGLVTSGTEIMQGRASQVARGLSTIAARIVKNQDALAEYGIQVEKTDGSLKSTFDVLSELKPKWDAMTDAQRVALGDTISGQNQYKVLASVMQNFQHAIDATNTALNSAGSAAKENAAYMESLEAREQALKAEFEDFSNRVLSKELVGGFIDAGTTMLDFANNDVGAAITRIGVLSTGVTGLVGIAGQTVGKIAEVGLQLKNLGVGGDSFLGMLASGKIALIVGGAVAAIALLAETIRAIKNAYDEAHPSFEDANKNLQETQTEIQNTTTELEEYKKKLQELDAINPKDRGSGWAAERAELETNVQTAEAYLEVLKQIEQAQTGKIEDSKYITGYTGQNVGDYTDGYIGTEASGQLKVTESQVKAITAEYTTQEEAVMSISLALKDYITGWETFKDMSMDDVVAELNDQLSALGINVHSTVETVSQSFDNMGALADKAADGFDKLTKAEQEQATQYLSDYQAYVQGVIDGGNVLDEAQQKSLQNYTRLQMATSGFNETQASSADIIAFVATQYNLSADAAARLAAAIGLIDSANIMVANGIVQLADGAYALKENCYQAADGLYYLKDGCDALAGAGSGAASELEQIGNAASNTTTATTELTNSLFDQNGKLTETASVALAGNSAMAALATSELQAQQAAANANFSNLIDQINQVGFAAIYASQELRSMMLLSAGTSGVGSDYKLQRQFEMETGMSASANDDTYARWVQKNMPTQTKQALLESILKQQSDMEKEYQDKIDAIKATQPSGTGGGGSSKKSAEEKAAEEAEKQAKKAQQAQEKAAKESQQAYESAAKSAEQAAQEAARAAEQAAEEAKQKILDSIQELKDASDDFWDSKTDAIEETNKELDRQKQLEEKLKALEEARQKKILLYKNGQFQYDKDYGTIAKAQADYEETRDKIQRERELEQLEEMKNNATEIFNEMKDIISNGGDVTQQMINNWLSQMQTDGANYYNSNKAILSDWLAWAQGAITEFSQSAVDAIYKSTSSLMSSGGYGSNASAAGSGSLIEGILEYMQDPKYRDEKGEYVGLASAWWIDRFEEQIKRGNFGDYTEAADWLGKTPGSSVFDDWQEVLNYWAVHGSGGFASMPSAEANKDMVDRLIAAKVVGARYKDVFASLGYDDIVEKLDKLANLDVNEVIKSSQIAGAIAHPEDPFGLRSLEGIDPDTVGGKLYSLLHDISDYELYTGSGAMTGRGKDYGKMSIAGDLRRSAKLSEWYQSTTKTGQRLNDDGSIYTYFEDVRDAAYDVKKLGEFFEDNEKVLDWLSNVAYYQAKTPEEQQAIHLEAEARRQAREYAGEILGYDVEGIKAKTEAEREANRTGGRTMLEAKQNRKTNENIAKIQDQLDEANKGRAMSDKYIQAASDYIGKVIEENAKKILESNDEASKKALEAQNAQLGLMQEQLKEKEGSLTGTTGTLPWEDTTFEDYDPTEDLRAIQEQMKANSKAWFDADEETRKQLHEANVRLAKQIEDLAGTRMEYEGHTGVWTEYARNANGTHNFRGGLSLVGENGPELRVLRRGDNIIPADKTENLWKWASLTPSSMLAAIGNRNTKAGDVSYGFNISNLQLPNATDAKSLVQGLKNYALQYSYKR